MSKAYTTTSMVRILVDEAIDMGLVKRDGGKWMTNLRGSVGIGTTAGFILDGMLKRREIRIGEFGTVLWEGK